MLLRLPCLLRSAAVAACLLLAVPATACPPGAAPSVYQPLMYRPAPCPVYATPAVRPALAPVAPFMVCTREADGVWRKRGDAETLEAAQKLVQALQALGLKASVWKQAGVPQGLALTLSTGELAIAIAVSVNGANVQALAKVGQSGRVEALAGPQPGPPQPPTLTQEVPTEPLVLTPADPQ